MCYVTYKVKKRRRVLRHLQSKKKRRRVLRHKVKKRRRVLRHLQIKKKDAVFGNLVSLSVCLSVT